MKSKTFRQFTAFCLIFLLSAHSAFATNPFSITLSFPSGTPANIQSEIQSIVTTLETDVNKDLPKDGASKYLKGMANSGVMAVKGLGTDYASNIDLFIVGGGIGIGADLGDNSLSDLAGGDIKANQIRGFGAQTSIMGGLQLGIFEMDKMDWFDPNRLTAFANFMAMNLPEFEKGFKGDILAFGLHAQYKLIEPMALPLGFIKWGGVDITTGFDYATMDISYTKAFSLTQSTQLSSGGGTATASYNGQVSAGAKVDIKTIPIEISTNVRILYLVSLFGGLAADLNFGSSSSRASLSGDPITITAPSNLGTISADPNLDLGVKGDADTFMARYFVGLQLNIALFKILVQLNQGIGNDTIGVMLGARFAW